MELNRALASGNALLTAGSLVCMLQGWRRIRAGDERSHRRWMLAACALGAAFMLGFAARFYLFGMTEFRGRGALKGLFYAIYFTHEPLAVVNIALAGAALILGLMGKRAEHRELARWALPVWVYVAATGLALYALLYPPISGS